LSELSPEQASDHNSSIRQAQEAARELEEVRQRLEEQKKENEERLKKEMEGWSKNILTNFIRTLLRFNFLLHKLYVVVWNISS